ncbi:lipoprotein BA_5634 family protein [Lysinibacillus sp. NPDC093190]|uniref:lipoprotein BA_5634 family protein n=1 Tax=Lysinibacillus sp. NPDC093190 TaxID=3390575 RepID=UPI003CFD3FF3
MKVDQKNKVKSIDLYKVKITEDNGHSVLIMDERTAKDIVTKGQGFRKVLFIWR